MVGLLCRRCCCCWLVGWFCYRRRSDRTSDQRGVCSIPVLLSFSFGSIFSPFRPVFASIHPSIHSFIALFFFYKSHENGARPDLAQLCSILNKDPDRLPTKKMMEYSNRPMLPHLARHSHHLVRYPPPPITADVVIVVVDDDDVDDHVSIVGMTFRYSSAGAVVVSGTLVRAPISDTRF